MHRWLVTVLMEVALITPPIGVNLHVVQGVRTNGGPFNEVACGAIPFVFMMMVFLIFMVLPQIA